MAAKLCRHNTVYFSDGGRKIRCLDCHLNWSVTTEYDGAMLGIFDFRAHPELVAKTNGESEPMTLPTRAWVAMKKANNEEK